MKVLGMAMFGALFSAFVVSAFGSSAAIAQDLPGAPTDPAHPGSLARPYAVRAETQTIDGRQVDIFLPKQRAEAGAPAPGPAPVIVFGHGQALDVDHYRESFEHFAAKGVAVIHPMYDTGFFDQNWRRMASDYQSLTKKALAQFPTELDGTRVVFAGHSKGGYVALMAAGVPAAQRLVNPGAIVLFAPAGFDQQYLGQVGLDVPVTLIWGEEDTIIKESLVLDIYQGLPSRKKQYIRVGSYRGFSEALPADHMFVLTRSSFFGGRDGASSLHFHGAWKWLLGAAEDLRTGALSDNPYLYGSETATSGTSSLNHKVQRSW